ncbi:C40 family peptidase [Salimicrobium salexigens]|uniref:Cell wall-associated hydrolase, NlpC family n=1 Tax=Salimicrobium salexigens TaxID=908941 RepID=A0ABY1KKI9_9BACI|nr:peptidoglycan-binding protein [Salimicrobium salexigens]SIS45709.1 Cell wall-associated hydrolase, NlpC family [Salimicrobium salexigens]
MNKPVHPLRKYVVSTALVTSLALTPLVGSSVSAQSNASTDNGSSVQITESNVLTAGDRGQAVSSLQSKLASYGYYGYNVDGKYGPITKNAVIAFQKQQGLAVDGIAGPNTQASLASGSVAPAPDTSSNNETEETQSDSDDSEERATAVKAASASTASTASASTGSASNADIVNAAESLIGVPYQYGGETRAALGSSGFINLVMEEAGTDVNRTHAGMWASDGVFVDSPSVGDVVFFENTYSVDRVATHSGIYIGGNKMIHAGSDGVEVSDMEDDYWENKYIGAKSIQ